MAKTRILIVDDEPHIRKVISNVLEKTESYDVASAADGQEAVDFLRERDYDWDIVVTDMMMPRMNGEAVVTTLRSEAPHISCLVLTAHKNDDNVVRCLGMGAIDYILKPISVGRFLQTIQRAVERHQRFEGKGEDIEVRREMDGWVELTAPSDFEYVERFQKFTALLGDAPLDPDEKEDIRVAIDELGQNAIEWGNRQDRKKRISLCYCIFHDRIVFKIQDQGEGFDPNALSDPSADPLAHIMNRMEEGKRAGGYGVYITKQLMDEIVYSERGNAVLLTKLFKKNGDTPQDESTAPPPPDTSGEDKGTG